MGKDARMGSEPYRGDAMMDTPCLRPASLSDAINGLGRPQFSPFSGWSGWHYVRDGVQYNYADLERLYDAEWALRGYTRAP